MYSFTKGASFITLTNVNEICPMDFEFDKQFKYFYENKHKHTLFENVNLQLKLKKKRKIFNINLVYNNFKNHVGDGKTRFNDMILDFHHIVVILLFNV